MNPEAYFLLSPVTPLFTRFHTRCCIDPQSIVLQNVEYFYSQARKLPTLYNLHNFALPGRLPCLILFFSVASILSFFCWYSLHQVLLLIFLCFFSILHFIQPFCFPIFFNPLHFLSFYHSSTLSFSFFMPFYLMLVLLIPQFFLHCFCDVLPICYRGENYLKYRESTENRYLDTPNKPYFVFLRGNVHYGNEYQLKL